MYVCMCVCKHDQSYGRRQKSSRRRPSQPHVVGGHPLSTRTLLTRRTCPTPLRLSSFLPHTAGLSPVAGKMKGCPEEVWKSPLRSSRSPCTRYEKPASRWFWPPRTMARWKRSGTLVGPGTNRWFRPGGSYENGWAGASPDVEDAAAREAPSARAPCSQHLCLTVQDRQSVQNFYMERNLDLIVVVTFIAKKKIFTADELLL